MYRYAMVKRHKVILGLLLLLCCCPDGKANSTEYENCTSYEYLDLIGDGVCDQANNNKACGWDGGDCCECACDDGPCFSGVETEIDCCMESYSTSPLCLPETQQNWLVENTTQARALAQALNCSGGTFEVVWSGSIVVDRTLVVVGGTTLSLTGVSPGALMDGRGSIGLITVSNASLSVSNMILLNGSSVSGGAITALGSNIFLNHTTFDGNVVTVDGGALFLARGSTLKSRGEIGFFNNRAASHGGAVYARESSTATWESGVTFSGNKASYGGAMVISSASNSLWEGVTMFSFNTAINHGGALYATGSSRASWEGKTIFVNNSVSTLGGAVFFTNSSSVKWSAETSFVANSGQYGGALCVDGSSNASWSGSTFFQENVAESGGAIIAAANSRVKLTGETMFTFNQAQLDGGAISSTLSSSVPYYTFSEEPAILVIEGKTSFEYNICGWNGGALAISEFLLLELMNTSVLTFRGNSAGAYGGAVYIVSMEEGPNFRGVIFDSNSAKAGGGVYALASGTALSSDPVTGDALEYATRFYNCTFVNNAAWHIGGGIRTDSGQDVITNSIFVGNTAFGGGGLLLAGTAYIANCLFQDNVAYTDGGPAIFSLGYLTGFVNITFDHNLPYCNAGYFIKFTEGQPEEVIAEVSGGEYSEACIGCNVGENALVPECVTLSEAGVYHVSSAGYVTTLEGLEVDEGYWRATASSTDILECYNSDACRGGITGATDYCSEGYKGAYCSVCKENYTTGLNFVCTSCMARTWGLVVASIGCALSLFVCIAVALYLVSANMRGSGRGIVDRIWRLIPLQSLKIIIVAWQIITQFSSVANVTFPDIYQSFLDAVDLLNFDASWVFSAGCVFSFDFHDRLLIATIGPIVGMTLLGITYSAASARHGRCETAMQNVQHKHMSMVLLLTFLVYSSVSSIVFQTFACEVLDDGKNYLRADYRIECDSPKHKTLQIYAGVMILLYPLGIPLLFTKLLFRNGDVLRKAEARDDSYEVKSIVDLWKPYKPSRFYYEIIECIRRISLTGAVVFIYPNTSPQIAVTLIMAFAFTILSEVLAPYDSRWDCWISRTGHIIVFLSMYIALLLKVDVSSERASSQKLLAGVLVAAHVCMVLVVVIEAVAMALAAQTQEENNPRPRVGPRQQSVLYTGRHAIHPTCSTNDEESRHDTELSDMSRSLPFMA